MNSFLWWLRLGGLLLAVLDVPFLSFAALFLVAGSELVAWTSAPRLAKGFASRLFLIVLFAAAYYAIAASHDIVDGVVATKYALAIIALYALGYRYGRAEKNGDRRAFPALLAFCSGFTAYAFLCVYSATNLGRYVEISERYVRSPWNPEQILNGPGVGAFASLGMCLLPMLFVPLRDQSWTRRLGMKAFILTIGVAGTYSNLALQNRTPVLALLLSVACTAGFLLVARHSIARWKVLGAVTTIGAAAASGAYAAFDALASRFILFQRFQSRGLTTPRYEAWIAVLEGMWSFPDGGRGVDLHGVLYAHNLWLDVAYDSGLLPLALLIAFHLIHVRQVARALRVPLPTELAILLVGTFVSFFATYVAEPTIAFSAIYFGVGCFLLGTIARVSDESLVAPLPNAARRQLGWFQTGHALGGPAR